MATQSPSFLFARQFDILRQEHEREKRTLMQNIATIRAEYEDSQASLRLVQEQLDHVRVFCAIRTREALARDHQGLDEIGRVASSSSEPGDPGGKLLT